MLDQNELRRMRWLISGFLFLSLALTVVGASTSVAVSDAAYTGAILSSVGISAWVIHWANSSRLVRWLTSGALLLIVFAQTLDITEDFDFLAQVPLLGSESYWNGHVASVAFLAGLVTTFAVLMFALVEARLGRIADEQHRLLAEHVSDVISTMDDDLRCTYVSPSVVQFRGFTVEEAMAQPLAARLVSSSLDRFLDRVNVERARLNRGERLPGESVTLDLEYTRSDGTTVWAETRFSFLTGAARFGGSLIAVTRDISERRRAEEERCRLTERLTLAIRSGNLGIWDWDIPANRVVWDERMGEIYGVALGAFEGTYDAWRDRIYPEDREGAVEDVSAALQGSREFQSRFRVVRAEGDVRHVEARGIVSRDAEGNALRIIGTNADITDAVQAEEERSALQSQLFQAQKMESVGSLAGGIAHDFNNMLMVILGHADLLRGKYDLGEILRDHVDEIRVAALRSADLTRQLLSFARQQVSAPREVNLNSATESMLKLLGRLIGEHIRLDWKPGSDVWPVKMDPSQVDQILANICVNAKDAIAGAGEIVIRTENVSLPGVGDFVRLTISDSGCGMDTDIQRRIFEPFYTTKQAGRGTGLGLSTVYGIVTQNQGHIQVLSAPGKGTTFQIDLPRLVGEVPQPEPEADVAPRIPQSNGKETILVVEDEASMLLVVNTMLEYLGYNVLFATTPSEALALAASHSGKIDLLLTDIVLPEVDGRVLAMEVLKIRGGVKCLFMSGYMSELEGEKGIMLDSSNFIEKPFVLQGLADKVRHVLDHDCSTSVATI